MFTSFFVFILFIASSFCELLFQLVYQSLLLRCCDFSTNSLFITIFFNYLYNYFSLIEKIKLFLCLVYPLNICIKFLFLGCLLDYTACMQFFHLVMCSLFLWYILLITFFHISYADVLSLSYERRLSPGVFFI